MAIDPNISGWQSIKAKLKAVIGVANKVENMTIQRGGTTDSVTFAGDSIKINVQDFPKQKPGGGGGGGGLSGIEIIWADQTETFILASDMLEDYDDEDYWSVVLEVSNGTFTQATPTYDATQELWDDVGEDQTEYRLRLITQGLDSEGDPVNAAISMYGQYRESILCVNGDPVTVLVKIS
jgi:hypothetical protein